MGRTYNIKTRGVAHKVNRVRDIMESAGNTIGSVKFKKRKNGAERVMAYRLHVAPKRDSKKGEDRRAVDTFRKKITDLKNLQMTVYDTNIRGAGVNSYRTVPLENVMEVRVHKKTYRFE